MKILVVDDPNAEEKDMNFYNQGYNTEEASDGFEA